MIRALARRWATTHVRDENRRLHADVAYLERTARALRHALTAAEHQSARLSARVMELTHERTEKP